MIWIKVRHGGNATLIVHSVTKILKTTGSERNACYKAKRGMIWIALICVVLFSASTTTVFAYGKGAKGPDVYAVQGMLKSLGYY